MTETIVKDGEVVAERHRFDSRLSIAVLNRPDKRCERAEERGSKHLALVARWDEWLALVGKGEEQAAAAMLDPAPAETANHCQKCQIAESENPTEAGEPEAVDLSERCWKDEDEWMTDFPPPRGFDGYESGSYGSVDYQRGRTPEEEELLEANEAIIAAEEVDHEAGVRDAWFEMLRAELEETAVPDSDEVVESQTRNNPC